MKSFVFMLIQKHHEMLWNNKGMKQKQPIEFLCACVCIHIMCMNKYQLLTLYKLFSHSSFYTLFYTTLQFAPKNFVFILCPKFLMNSCRDFTIMSVSNFKDIQYKLKKILLVLSLFSFFSFKAVMSYSKKQHIHIPNARVSPFFVCTLITVDKPL